MDKSTAVVKWFNDKKGYGFLIDELDQDRFVHHRHILMAGFKTLKEGQLVEYKPLVTSGGLAAAEVVPLNMLEETASELATEALPA